MLNPTRVGRLARGSKSVRDYDLVRGLAQNPTQEALETRERAPRTSGKTTYDAPPVMGRPKTLKVWLLAHDKATANAPAGAHVEPFLAEFP